MTDWAGEFGTARSPARAISSLCLRLTTPKRERCVSSAVISALARIDEVTTRPFTLRSSGTMTRPSAATALGDRLVRRRPFNRTSPLDRMSPISPRARLVRPEPTRPARPNTSPRWIVRLTGRLPRTEKSTSSRTGAGLVDREAAFAGSSALACSDAGPVNSRVNSSIVRSPAPYDATTLLSRSTVIRSAICSTSSRKWLM